MDIIKEDCNGSPLFVYHNFQTEKAEHKALPFSKRQIIDVHLIY